MSLYNTLACPDCSRDARKRASKPSSTHTPKATRSKRLKKLRILSGKHSDEIIMVSSSDYEMLLATGAYEPVKDLSDSKSNDNDNNNMNNMNNNDNNNDLESERLMKEVYGKQKSPYRKAAMTTRSNTSGPRSRTVVISMATAPSSQENNMITTNGHNIRNMESSGDRDGFVKEKEEGRQEKEVQKEKGNGEGMDLMGQGDDLSVRGMGFENDDPMYFEEQMLFEDGFEEEEDLSQYFQVRSDQQRADLSHKNEEGEEGWSFS